VSARSRAGTRPPLERAALGLETVAAYARARRELRRAPIEQVVERLRPPGSAAGEPGAAQREEARRLGWVVVRTLRFLPGDTRCLRRSLVLLQLLARRGIAARLVIGARTRPDFLAHAWVECGGVPVLSPLEGSFGRLVEL
jgi:hypothetical protein